MKYWIQLLGFALFTGLLGGLIGTWVAKDAINRPIIFGSWYIDGTIWGIGIGSGLWLLCLLAAILTKIEVKK